MKERELLGHTLQNAMLKQELEWQACKPPQASADSVWATLPGLSVRAMVRTSPRGPQPHPAGSAHPWAVLQGLTLPLGLISRGREVAGRFCQLSLVNGPHIGLYTGVLPLLCLPLDLSHCNPQSQKHDKPRAWGSPLSGHSLGRDCAVAICSPNPRRRLSGGEPNPEAPVVHTGAALWAHLEKSQSRGCVVLMSEV